MISRHKQKCKQLEQDNLKMKQEKEELVVSRFLFLVHITLCTCMLCTIPVADGGDNERSPRMYHSIEKS